MAVYTDLTFEQVRHFVHQFDIGDLLNCEGIAQGVENSNFKISTSQGRYILTLYEKRVRREDLPWFLGLMQFVSNAGLPVPNPVADSHGKTIHYLEGKPAALTTFLPGKSLQSIEKKHCLALGRALAQFHIKARPFPHVRKNSMGCQVWPELLDRCQKGLEKIGKPSLYNELRGFLKHIKTHWPQAETDSLMCGQIHADLFPDNVFFEGENVSGLIDFYFACTDFLAYDIAICLSSWCFIEKSGMQLDLAKSLLEGYQQERPLSKEEKDKLPIFLQGAAMRFLLTRLYDWVYTPAGALVERKDPMAYLLRLRAFQSLEDSHVFN